MLWQFNAKLDSEHTCPSKPNQPVKIGLRVPSSRKSTSKYKGAAAASEKENQPEFNLTIDEEKTGQESEFQDVPRSKLDRNSLWAEFAVNKDTGFARHGGSLLNFAGPIDCTSNL